MNMAEALLPAELLQTVDDVDSALKKVEKLLSTVLPSCTRESFEELSSVQRASTVFAFAKTLTVLFSVYLRTNGVLPDDHPAKSELERIDLYQGKVQKEVDRTTGPRRPASSLDVRAANRFIEHAIPDLPADQKKRVREIGKKGLKRQQERERMNKVRTKRSSGLTIAEETAAFLAEAKEELLIKRDEMDNEKD